MKLLRPIILLFVVLLAQNTHSQNITINEIQSSNGNTIQDEDGDYEDWVELFNSDTIAINLSGWKLSDNQNNPNKWTFPSAVIEPGEFLIIFTSGKNKHSGAYIHTNFSISAAGEPILLSRNDGVLIDLVPAIAIPRDKSYGRRYNGQLSFVFFDSPTPGASNEIATISGPTNLLTPNFPSGFYDSEITLVYTDNLHDSVQIYYTTDGSDPSPLSNFYSDSILIFDRSSEPNGISMIRTNPEFAKFGEITEMPWRWKEPRESIYKGTTIQAQAYIGDSAVSAITTHSYFIHPEGRNRYSLPVISITIPSKYLFDYDSGIYVPGAAFNEDAEWNWYWGSGNYFNKGASWERKGHFCYIDTLNQVGVERNVGIRIQGSASAALPIKSLRFYSRADHSGNNFNYQFFPNSNFKNYERIIARNSGQDYRTTYFIDAFTQNLLSDLDIEKQEYVPTVVFINGEYWGIHNIRERIDNKFLGYKKGVDENNIDLIGYSLDVIIEEGDYSHYQNEIEFFIDANQANLNDTLVYNKLDNLIDFRNHIDYTISKIYFGIYDWPGNNIEFWRERKDGSKYRWISYDNDDAFARPLLNSLEHITFEGGVTYPNPDFSTHLFRNLIQINRYKDSFLARFEYHMNNTFEIKKVISILNDMSSKIRPEMTEHSARWQYPASIDEWEKNIESLREKIIIRTCFVKEMIFDFFVIDDKNYMKDVCDNIGVRNITSNNVIELFPNPNNGGFTIKSRQIKQYKEVEIIGINGQQIWKKQISELKSNNFNLINIETNLSSGVYYIKIYGDNITQTFKFIVL